MPNDFTICSAYKIEAWTTPFTTVILYVLTAQPVVAYSSAYVTINAGDTFTEFRVSIGNVHNDVRSDEVLFPLTWTRLCLSLDRMTGKIRLVVNGEVVIDKDHKEALDEDDWRPADLDLVLGYRWDGIELTGTISQLNIFSSPLPTARMVALTSAGGEECGAPGDYVSWEEEDWKLTSQARMEMVGELEGPCRRESEVTVYTAHFEYHGVATNPGKVSGCMEHCEKLGQGRSPPVRTLEEWHWLRKEVQAVTPDIKVLGNIWVAATDEEEEDVWRDAYPPYDQLNSSLAWPWFERKDRKGDKYNCLYWETYRPDEKAWKEFECGSYAMSCLKVVS